MSEEDKESIARWRSIGAYVDNPNDAIEDGVALMSISHPSTLNAESLEEVEIELTDEMLKQIEARQILANGWWDSLSDTDKQRYIIMVYKDWVND